MQTAAQYAREAAALAAAGQDGEAAALYDRGMMRFPSDARLANSAGNFHARARRDERALEYFERSLTLDPDFAEAAINAAIVLQRIGRPRAAEELLSSREASLGGTARYWLLRSDNAKALGGFDAAANHLLRAERLEPGNPRAARQRARLRLERGEAGAVGEYESALQRDPGNFDLMEGYALALQAAGQLEDAIDFAGALASHFPQWTAGQGLLAELRWAARDPDYTGHFEAAAAAHPAPEIYLEWARLLSGNDSHAQAAEVLARGAERWPDDARLRLEQAVTLGEAGNPEDADAILSACPDEASRDWLLVRGRIDLALARPDIAAIRLEKLVQADIGNVPAWSLLDLCWRLLDDRRHDWLHGRPELVRELELPLSTGQLSGIRHILQGLHTTAAIPLAQSVKGGTQTQGALFARPEPELAQLKEALGSVLESYRQGLPPADPAHPLLSQRDAPWMIAGSWSVRFDGNGRHAAHIHPRGLLSSACYIVVPPEVDDPGGPGWLELGRPPPGLAPGLEPLHAIRPRPGTCALFPSTLFHGTRALHAGERMTVAFDVAPLPA